MNREADVSVDIDEYRKRWSDTINAEAERAAALEKVYFRAEVIWKLMCAAYAVTDQDLLNKLDDLHRNTISPDKGLTVTCPVCDRQYRIFDTLRPACVYCGDLPSEIEGRIPFDGSSLFVPFPEWLRGTDFFTLSKATDIPFLNPDHTNEGKLYSIMLQKITPFVMPLIMPLANNIGEDEESLKKSHGINFTPHLQKFCSVLLSMWQIFYEKTGAGVESLAGEVFRLLDKLAEERAPAIPMPPFEYLSILTAAVSNKVFTAASRTESDYKEMSDRLAEERAAVHENEISSFCPVCGRRIQALKSSPGTCMYCGSKIEPDSAAKLFRVKFT